MRVTADPADISVSSTTFWPPLVRVAPWNVIVFVALAPSIAPTETFSL